MTRVAGIFSTGRYSAIAAVLVLVLSPAILYAQQIELTAKPRKVAPGGQIELNWHAPTGRPAKDWIGFFSKKANNHQRIGATVFVEGRTSGTLRIPAPAALGAYEFRYLENNGHKDLAKSNSIAVTDKGLGFKLTAGQSTITPSGGIPLTVAWQAPAGRPDGDWIGLFRVKSNNHQRIGPWTKTGGKTSGSFKTTSPPGEDRYEFRYLVNGGHMDVARSAPILVSAKETAAQFSLKATPDLAPPGSGVPIAVTWRAPNGRPKNDWVALFAIKGNNHQRIGPWTQTAGKASGSLEVPAPTGEGIYEFRYLLNSGHTDITRSNPITIDAAKTAAGFRLRANPDRAPPGGALPITVEWQAPEGRPKNDWVALFRIGDNNHQRIGPWTHTQGKAKGTFEVPSPAGDGLYEFRYLLSGGHTDIARTNPVVVNRSVTEKPFTVTIEPARAEPGAKLTIAWTAPKGRPKNDWIAFFLRGANNHQRIGRWVHTEGKTKGSFETVAPGGIGTYEARYMTSGGHADMARSKPVAINHADAAYRLTTASSVAPGKPMKVQWQAPAGRPANDWVALFSVEGNNHQRVGAWVSTKGQRSGDFDRTAPTNPGLYEFRYLLAGGHADVTRSPVIRVGEAKGKAPPPVPKVHTVTAADGRAPRAGTTIIIKGQGFAPLPGGNRVFFGKGAGIQPTRASATELQVTVPGQAKRLDVVVGRTGAKTRSVPYQTIFAPQATAKVAGTAQADLKRLQAALGDQTPLAAAATEGGSRIGGALKQAASAIGAAHQAIGRPNPETRARIADTWQAMGLPALIKDVEAAMKAARAKAADSMDATLSARSAAAGAGAAARAMGEGFARACRAVAATARGVCDAIERAAQTVAGTADRITTWVGSRSADPTRTAGQQPTGGQTGSQPGAQAGGQNAGGQTGGQTSDRTGGGAGRDIPPPDEDKPEDKPEDKKPEEEKLPGRSVDELESGGWVVFLAKSIGAFIENTETYADRKSCTLLYGGLCSKDSPTLRKFSPRVLYGPFPDRYGAEVAYCDNLDKDSVRYVLGVVWGTIGGIRTAVGNRPSCPPTKPTPTRSVDPRKPDDEKEDDPKADVDLNLVMAGVSNDEEERLGGYVRLNRDDDNGNKTPDLKDSGTINGENDLLGIELRTRRSRQDIPITLAATKGGSRIRVWTGPRRTNEIKLPFTWKGEEPSKLPGGSPGAIVPIPVKLFVEGVSTSADIADVGLRLYVSGNRGWLTDKSEAEDRVSLTVFDVDLGMPGLPPDQENDLLIGLNDDDDDRDVKEDRNNGGRPVRGEDDLHQVSVTVTPPLPPRAATVALEVGAGLKLWEDAGAGKIAVDAGRGVVRKPLPTAVHGKKAYFVEGYGLASKPAEIAVEVDIRGAGTLGKITEKLPLTVARADISIDGFTDEGEKEFFEGGLVAKARLPAPDPSEMTVLNLSVDAAGNNFGRNACVDIHVPRGGNDIALYTKSGSRYSPLPSLTCPGGGLASGALPKQIHVRGLRKTAEQGAEINLRVWDKTPKRPFGIVHRDRISLTVLEDGLLLWPRIMFITGTGGSRDMTVTLKRATGAEVDVSKHPDTEYGWIGKSDGSLASKAMNTIGVALANRALAKLKTKSGQSLGLKLITKFSVTKGRLTAGAPGIQLVWSVHKGIPSNYSLIFVGLGLQSIEIEPMRLAPGTLPQLVTDAFSLAREKNHPLVLTSDANGWVSDKGQLWLTDMRFGILNKGPSVSVAALGAAAFEVVKALSLPALTAALAPEVGPPAAPFVARAVMWAGGKLAASGASYAATNALAFQSLNTGVVSVSNAGFGWLTIPSLGGYVQSGSSGITGVRGTLDLGWLGKASDTVLIWVLPDLETVQIETIGDPPGHHTAPILIDVNGPRWPGPPARAFAETVLTNSSDIPLPKSVRPGVDVVKGFLPAALWASHAINFERTVPGTRFRLSLKGSYQVTDKGPKSVVVVFRDLKMGFHVPNNITGVSTVATSNDWALENPSLGTVDPRDTFDAYILHNNAGGTGDTNITSTVAFSGMGSAKGKRVVRFLKDEIIIRPPSRTIVLGVTPGNEARYRAIKRYADGREEDVTTRATWVGSNNAVARMEPGGRAVGLSPGEITLTASEGRLTSDPATLKVIEQIASCLVDPDDKQVKPGDTVTYTVSVTYISGATASVATGITWSSSDTNVADIAADGVATAKAIGDTNIGADLSGITCTPGLLKVRKKPDASAKIDLDLSIVGVPEDREESVGGHVRLNRDDDNANKIEDRADKGAVKGENDLVALTLRVDLSKPDIPVRLEATKGAAKIRVWRDPGRASELPLPFTWESQGESWLAGGGTTEALVPKRLFVEGIQTSGSLADVGLQLSAGTGPGWLTGGAKDADSVTLTVVDLDVSIADLEPEKETGVHIGYNDDDDDRDDKVDLGNSSRPVKNEDDTRAIDVTVQPDLPTGRAKVQLNVKPGVKLWRNALADNLFADPATTPVTKTLGEADQKKKRFFAEGVNLKPPPSEISLEVAIAGAIGDWMDKINLAVARADISIADFADSGEKEYWEGGYVAKSTKPTPDEKELTTLLLSASVSAGKFGPDTCIDLAIVKGIGDFRLFTKTGGTLKPLTIINCPAGGFKPAALPKKIHVQGLNATADRGIELQLRFWEKTTKGTFGIVHRDRISLTVLEEELRLRPRLVFIPGKSGERDLSAILKRRSGTEVEVRAHPDTRYHWIGKAYPGDSLAVRVMKAATLAAANKMLVAINKSALKKYGTSPGLKLITKFDVDKGKIKAGEPGMQIVWATHNGLQSNATIVFVGLVLESIQLEPEPVSRLTMSHILTRSLGGLTTKNKPLVLSTDDNGWLADKGQILLEEMTFQLLEKGPKIPLGAVTTALTEFARKLSLGPLTLAFSETGVLAPYLADIVSHGASGVARKTTKYIATNLVTYESTDKSIATVTNAAFSLTKGAALGGFVQSGVSGFVGIKGTLDAGKLGKALDTVITWVLPDLETVDIETKNDPPGDHTAPILIDTQKPAKPGPAVRAFARTNITKASEIEFDKKAAVKSLKAAGTVLPKALLTLGPLAFGTTVDLSGTVAASTFRLEITGTIGLADKGPKKAAIQFRDFKIGFHVPNNIAGFDKVLLRNDWSIKDPPIVRIDPDNIEWFDVHILHKGPDQTGKTEIATIVSLAGMGSASGTRPVETRKDELVVTPPTATIVLGVTPDDAAQYRATRKYADGREEDVSDRATWSGDDDAIARLERGGRAIGLVPGEIKLQATEGGLTSNQAELIVTQNPASCVVAPSEAQAQIGETVTFTAVATFSSGATGAVTSNVRWASGVSTVATVAGGEATALTEGETDIFASFAEIKCAPAKLTVSRDIITGPPPLNPVFTHAGAAVALGDLDGDGDLDAFVANFGNPNIVWLNNGDGSFDWSGEHLSNRRSTDVALADLDGDGDLDAYVTNFNQYDRIWLNNGKGLFKVARTELDQGRGRSVALGDIDKDGDVDAFVAREGQPDRIWLNTGRDGQLTEDKTAMEAIDSDSMGVALGDIDQDGDLDAIVVTDHGASNELWLNESSRFNLAEQGPGKGISRAVVMADLDDDGDEDIFVVNAAGDGNEIWLNLAGDLFDSGQRLDSIQGADADAGDLDGDGDRDVYVASDGRGNRIWLNDGAGAFEDSKEDLGRAKSTGIALGDLDGDGDLDAFVVNDGEPDHVWMNEDFGKSSR